MEKNRLVAIIEDHAKLEDVICDLRNAIDGGTIPNTCPSFNDSWLYDNITYIYDKIEDLLKK